MVPSSLRRVVTVATVVALSASALLAGTTQAAPDPTVATAPSVAGPIPLTTALGDPARGYPFMATPIDLAARGYVEEEYFISGTEACRYGIVGQATATVIACDGTYTTRIMVRRPTTAATFNGTVLLEWQNVTAQYDVDHYWLESSDHIMRSGYAWVGVSAQRAGVTATFPCIPAAQVFAGCNALKTWSPARYAPLDIPATSPGDAYSYDIFSQAAAALRSPNADGPDPLGALDPEVVVAIGTSQSAGRLAAYYNSILPLQADPVVDAVFLGEGRSPVRTDLPMPVLRLLSEVDVAATFAPPDADNYRQWEVAGASHADFGFTSKIQEFIERGDILQTSPVCNRPAPSQIPKRYVYNAAWDRMVDWVTDGVAPPIAPRITYVDGAIARDAQGNALGGIALSEHSVATAYNGTGNGGGTFCNLFGVHEPFSSAQLKGLYRNQGAYVSAVAKANNANRAAGFLLPADSAESTSNAAQSKVTKN